MAISNQMLVGTGCLIVIALVVATNKADDTDIEMGEGQSGGGDDDDPTLAIRSGADQAPTQVEVQDEINSAADLARRWDIAKSGFPTLNDLQDLRTEAQMINARAQHVFRNRRPFFDDDAFKRVFDQHIARVLTQIEEKRQQLAESMPVDEVTRVPQNAGDPKETLQSGRVDFSQDSPPDEWPDIPEDFEQTESDMNKMINQFADQEEGVTTVPPQDSGFRQAPDPLNADEEEPEGSNKRAAEDDADGFNESSAPGNVVASEPAKITDILEDPTTDFESAVDPPPSQPQVSPPPVVAAEKPTHKEVLQHETNATGDSAFNSTNDKTFGDELEQDAREENLEEARQKEEDPVQQFEKDKMIEDTQEDTPSEAQKDASYKRLQVQLSSYVEAIHRIDVQIREGADNAASGPLTLMKQYVQYIKLSKTINAKERKLRKEILEYAEAALLRVLSFVGNVKTPKRARDDSGLPPEGGSGGKKPRNIRRV